MCGIAGIFSFEKFNNKQNIKELVKTLLIDIKSRGIDATGLSLINTKEDKIKVFKQNIDATEFIKQKRFNNIFKEIKKYNIVLLHTRHTTSGTEEKNINNHPHFNKVNNNVLIHNGIITNYLALKEKYKDLCLKGECDSEVILSLFNKKKYNLKKALKLIRGTLAISLYHDRNLYFYKNDNPLSMCFNKTKNLYLFSSHSYIFSCLFDYKAEQINGIFDFYKSTDEYSVMEFDDDDFLKIDFNKKRFRKSTAEIDDWYSCSGYGGYGSVGITEDKTEDKTENKTTEETTEDKTEITPLKIVNERELTNEFLRKELEADNKGDNLIEYLNDEEYKKAIEQEEKEQQQRQNVKIHRQPLSYDSYCNYYQKW